MHTDDVVTRLPTGLVRIIQATVVCRFLPSGKMRIITAYRPEE